MRGGSKVRRPKVGTLSPEGWRGAWSGSLRTDKEGEVGLKVESLNVEGGSPEPGARNPEARPGVWDLGAGS